MDDVSSLIGLLEKMGSIITLLLILGPLPASLKALKTKNVDALPILFLFGTTSGALVWGIYAYFLHQMSLFLVNAFGVMISVLYTSSYFIAVGKNSVIFLNVLSVIVAASFCFLVVPVNIMGTSGCIISLFTNFALLAPVKRCLVEKTSKYINIPVLSLQTLSTITFFFLGFFMRDIYYSLPNIVGMYLGFTQFFIVFWTKGYIKDNCFAMLVLQALFSKEINGAKFNLMLGCEFWCCTKRIEESELIKKGGKRKRVASREIVNEEENIKFNEEEESRVSETTIDFPEEKIEIEDLSDQDEIIA